PPPPPPARLTIPVVLGPVNPHQQFSPAADAASTGPSPDDVPFTVRGNSSRFHRAHVSISGGVSSSESARR
ncbi:MAG: hypothetical protein ABWZ76_07455, partial [Acidimicrobiales bacterium]